MTDEGQFAPGGQESSPLPQASPGEMLRAARQAAGVHIEALAVSLKVPISKLEALEADDFDALISKRCYKESMSFDQAFAIIEDSMGSHFDPDIAKVFLSIRPRIEEISKSDFSEQ